MSNLLNHLKQLQEAGKNTKTSPQQDREKAKQKIELDEAKEARRKHADLLKEKALDDRIVDEFRAYLGKDDMRFNISAPKLPRSNGKREPSAAVLVLSDTHFGQVVMPEHTNGLGDYNPKKALGMAQHLQDTTVEILTRDHPCSELHVMLLGDLVHGCLNHAEEIPGRIHVSDQIALATYTLWQFIANISRVVPKVFVYGLGGNHSRLPNQKKPPTNGRFSNFDRIVLENMELVNSASGIKNIEFCLEKGQFQIIDIKGWRFMTSHGDQLRGGDKAMGVPVHSIAREINSFSARLVAQGQKAPDYYIVGDKHKALSLPTARGEYLINGAWPGIDEYVLSGGFAPNRPQQLLFGVHEHLGKSWSYNMYVDKVSPSTYSLSKSLEKVISRF